jgi:hypothetical protein
MQFVTKEAIRQVLKTQSRHLILDVQSIVIDYLGLCVTTAKVGFFNILSCSMLCMACRLPYINHHH